MDTYSKLLLTAIAVGVWVIAGHLVLSRGGAPTVADFRELQSIDDQKKLAEARKKLGGRMPYVLVYGGSIDVQ